MLGLQGNHDAFYQSHISCRITKTYNLKLLFII